MRAILQNIINHPAADKCFNPHTKNQLTTLMASLIIDNSSHINIQEIIQNIDECRAVSKAVKSVSKEISNNLTVKLDDLYHIIREQNTMNNSSLDNFTMNNSSLDNVDKETDHSLTIASTEKKK